MTVAHYSISMYLHLKTVAIESTYMMEDIKEEILNEFPEIKKCMGTQEYLYYLDYVEYLTNLYWYNFMMGLIPESPFYTEED